MRIPRPGPGKGWRQTISSGNPSFVPTARTSSLKSWRNGSTSSNSRSSGSPPTLRSEEHTSELQSRFDIVCRLLHEKKYQYTDRVLHRLSHSCINDLHKITFSNYIHSLAASYTLSLHDALPILGRGKAGARRFRRVTPVSCRPRELRL